MKKVFLIFLLTAGSLYAQPIQQQQQQQHPVNMNLEKAAKYKKMKTAGAIMMPVGAIMFVTGMVLYVSAEVEVIQATTAASNSSSNSGSTATPTVQPSYGKLIGGDLLMVAGAPMTAGGVVLFVIGNKKQKKYSQAVSLSTTRSGLGFTCTF